MTNSTTSSLNLSIKSNQVGAESAMEIKITNQAIAKDVREIEITNQAAVEDAREIKITNQAATEDGSLTHITFMDPKLYLAAADGDIGVLKQYNLEKHDLLVQLTPKKNTVLHVAAQFGQAGCVEGILGLGSPSLLLQQPNVKGDTPLHLATREGHLKMVKNLINAAKQLQEGDTESGGTTCCQEMLRMTNEEKDTALHEAVRCCHPEVVKLLIQEDAEFTYGANAEGKTPLYIAAEWEFGDLVQMILDNCTSPAYSGMKGRTALHAAVILNNQAMTKKILDWKPTLTKELDEDGWSPLHFAAYVGCDPTIVKQLLNEFGRDVVYLGVKAHGNRTALHIAASRGHVDIVKVLVSNFPDCCEKVDDEGNNVLHLIMPKGVIFATSGLSNIRWLRVRGLMNEKNIEGKTPLHLFHSSYLSKDFELSETMLMSILDSLAKILDFLPIRRRQSSKVSFRPLGSLEIKEDNDDNKSEESEISDMKKTIKIHMIVAALIATVTFAAGFTLPGGYIQNGSKNEGMAVLSLPTNGTNGTNRHIAREERLDFETFVLVDSIAMVLSMCAIVIYVIGSFPKKSKRIVKACLLYGNFLTMVAITTMVYAFVEGLLAVLHPSSLVEGVTTLALPIFWVLFLVPLMLAAIPSRRWILYWKKVKSFTLM